MMGSSPSRRQNAEAVENTKTMDGSPKSGVGRRSERLESFDLASHQRRQVATSLPPYVQQFSNTTSFILNRIKGGNGGLDSALSNLSGSSTAHSKDAYEDARTKVVQSLTRGLATDPLTPSSSSVLSVKSEPAIVSNTGIKRKREEDDDDQAVDFTKNTIPLPVPRPKADPDFLAKLEKRKQQGPIEYDCAECHDKLNKPHNVLLTCTGCWQSWHQACVRPPSKELNPIRYIICLPCEARQQAVKAAAQAHRAEQLKLRQSIDRVREKRLANLPNGITPAKAELVGFTGRGAPTADKIEHFSSMKKTDVLNMLSFCDQLKPGLLVDIMVSVSNRHSDLPVFDTPDWEVYASSLAHRPPQPRGPKPRHLQVPHKPRHGHSIASPKVKQRIKPVRIAPVKRPSKLSNVVEPEDEVVYEEEDSLPSTWPKPGQGLYAELVPEVEDRRFLRDENDEEAFSQFMVDKNGMQVV